MSTDLMLAEQIIRKILGQGRLRIRSVGQLAWLPVTLLVIGVACMSLTVVAQDQKLDYSVIRNGDVIGHLHFLQSKQGNITRLAVDSEVKTRLLLLLVIWAREETVFRDGIMVSSMVHRKLNGKERTNIQTRLVGNTYEINNQGTMERFEKYPIHFNMLSMYCNEPRFVDKAYADFFNEFVPVQRTGANSYKVTLPDGNYNNYFYRDGVCTMVDVHHNLYSLKFVLNR